MVLGNNFFSTVAGNTSLSASSATSLLDFVRVIQTQVQFLTIFILTTNKFSSQIIDHVEVLSCLSVPSLHLTNSTPFQLRGTYGADILAIVYLELDSYSDVLHTLAKFLNHLTQTRIVFVCFGMAHVLSDFLHQSWTSKMINSVAFIAGTSTYMSFTPFPEFRTTQHSVYDTRAVFPNRMANVLGYPFRAATDGIEPRNFFYTNRRGEVCIGGYTANLVKAFARKINATLILPMGVQKNITYHTDHERFIETDVVDIFIGLSAHSLSTKGESCVAEIIDWCVMLPVESLLPVYVYFTMIFGSLSFIFMFVMVAVFSATISCFLRVERRARTPLMGFFLKENCLRSLLGQSPSGRMNFSMKLRTIYFLSYVWGVFFNTWYLATLDMLYTSPPRERPIRTLHDLYQAPLKVLIYRVEYLEVLKLTDDYEKYVGTLEITNDHDWYHAKRNELNRSYAYPVPKNKWKTLDEQQSLYKEPIFRLTDICFLRFTPLVFLLHENSVFTEELNKVILQAHQSGLLNFWVKRAVLELIEAGRIVLKPEASEKRRHQVTVHDLQGIFQMFGVFIGISCAVFGAEHAFHRFMSRARFCSF